MIIGLYSPGPRMGKGTFADVISKQTGAFTVGFGDILRQVIVKITAPFLEGGEDEAWEWLLDERKDLQMIPGIDKTQRFMLDTLGTDWARNMIHPDIWVMALERQIDNILSYYAEGKTNPLIIVDDLRKPNEYEWLKSQGAILVRLYRPNTPILPKHVAHGALEGFEFDYYLTCSSVEEVQAAAQTFLDVEQRIAS